MYSHHRSAASSIYCSIAECTYYTLLAVTSLNLLLLAASSRLLLLRAERKARISNETEKFIN